MAESQTPAARRWLALAEQKLDAERYQNLLRHVSDLRGPRLTKRVCMSALVALWAEEGLPEQEAT